VTLIDRDPAPYALTPGERSQFEQDGFLIVPDALDESTLADTRRAAEERDERYRSQDGIGPHHVLNAHDLVGTEPIWLELVDQPTTFVKVLGIMGWHIQLFHTQLLVTPPAPAAGTPGPYGWHQDNNRMSTDLGASAQPMVSLKVGYFLTSLPSSGMGNLAVIPGSHRDASPRTDDAIEIIARAGDAVIFDRRLWHSATTNRSTSTRTFVTYGYSYRWLRPKSAMRLDALFDQVDPIRRQLLGYATSANGYFDPEPEEVPLRAWTQEHLPAR
jgi:ectoine hydroxylase-related dioxygenase (phytanoyl-CoA dioxygenase family)